MPRTALYWTAVGIALVRAAWRAVGGSPPQLLHLKDDVRVWTWGPPDEQGFYTRNEKLTGRPLG